MTENATIPPTPESPETTPAALAPPPEPPPMLDVHPPHHAASTWHEFFIHIATIVLGLIIAVGLEQAVEAVHHRHQRLQLVEEIHKDCEANSQYIKDDLTADQKIIDWARSQATVIERAGPTAPARMQRMPSTKIYRPDAGVWPAAKANGQASLLSTGQQNWFDDLELVQNQLFVSNTSSTARLYAAYQNLDQALVGHAVDTPSGDLDLATLNPAQRDAVVDRLNSIAEQARDVMQNLVSYLNDLEYILTTPGDQLDSAEGMKHYLDIARRNAEAQPQLQYTFSAR